MTEIAFRGRNYTIRTLNGARTVLRHVRGHLWKVCAGPEAAVILAGIDTRAVA